MGRKKPTVEMSASGKALFGLGLLLAAGLSLALPWLALSSMQEDHDHAVAQQAWVETQCRVTASRRHEIQVTDGVEQTVTTEFSLEADGQTYDGLSFTYPYYGAPWKPHEVSASIPCWYDPASPRSVTLFKKSAPGEPRPTAGVLQVFFTALGLLLLAGGVYVLLTKRKLYVG